MSAVDTPGGPQCSAALRHSIPRVVFRTVLSTVLSILCNRYPGYLGVLGTVDTLETQGAAAICGKQHNLQG